MAALDYITIKGFKSIASVEKLTLRRINLIIGPNGSGKSNIIGAFSFLHAIRDGRLQEYVAKSGGAEHLLHFGSKTTSTIEIALSFDKEVNQYSIELVSAGDDRLVPTGEAVYFWDKKKYATRYSQGLSSYGMEAGISVAYSAGVRSHVRSHLNSWRVYHFHDTSVNSPLKKTNDVNDNRFLRPDGSNLAAYLYFLAQEHSEDYKLIIGAVQRVAPFFEDCVLEPQRLNPDKILLEWRHMGSDAYFGASSLSDGTLRFIALATLLAQPYELRPSVILIDEPELGLHPYAISMLASLIKQASKRTQVIVSTQSSLLLDHFEPQDVLVAERVDGGTTLKRLEPEPLEGWLEDYSLGQLWEKNEFGGRPKAE